MHRRYLVIAYGLKGVSEGAFEHTVLPDISPSYSSMGWGPLQARTSFTRHSSWNVYPQNNANATTSTYPSCCTLHNNHNMNKSSSSPTFPRNCGLLPRIGSSARIQQCIAWPRILPWARDAYNGKCAPAGPSIKTCLCVG